MKAKLPVVRIRRAVIHERHPDAIEAAIEYAETELPATVRRVIEI